MAWLGTFIASKLFLYFILPVVGVGLIFGAIKVHDWNVAREALIEGQRDALIELAKRQEATVADKAARDAAMRRLPDERVRWCAILPKPSGCCTPTGPCPQVGAP